MFHEYFFAVLRPNRATQLGLESGQWSEVGENGFRNVKRGTYNYIYFINTVID